MSDVQAALGLVQLAKLEVNIARRMEITRRYTSAFSQMPELIPAPSAQPGDRHAHHLYILRLRLDRLRVDRNGFFRELRSREIGASVHFIPVYHLSYYRERFGWRPEEFPVAEAIFCSSISLPCFPRMGDSDVERVVAAVAEIVENHRA
jgi:dTDP-4-amino-4,6-dideoxygalactose transaminase